MAGPNPYVLTADNTTVTADTTRYTADGAVLLPWVFDPASVRTAGTQLTEIPVIDPPCTMAIRLAGTVLRLRFQFCGAPDEGTWILDINDAENAPLVHGIPIMPGLDLLEPYAYLGLGFRLFVHTAGDVERIPGFADFNGNSRLYAELPAAAA